MSYRGKDLLITTLTQPPQPTIRTKFREAMARVCAPVNIVTTDGPAGRGGFTATAMCSVSDGRPMLLVCMNKRSAQTSMFPANQRFCVNVLTQLHMHLAVKFAGDPRHGRALSGRALADHAVRHAGAARRHRQLRLRDRAVNKVGM